MTREEFEQACHLLKANGYSKSEFFSFYIIDCGESLIKSREISYENQLSNLNRFEASISKVLSLRILTLEDFRKIPIELLKFMCIDVGISNRQIADKFNISPNSVSRKLNKNGYNKNHSYTVSLIPQELGEKYINTLKEILSFN